VAASCNTIRSSFCYKCWRLLTVTFRFFPCIDKRTCHWFTFAVGTPPPPCIPSVPAATQMTRCPHLQDAIERSPCRTTDRLQRCNAGGNFCWMIALTALTSRFTLFVFPSINPRLAWSLISQLLFFQWDQTTSGTLQNLYFRRWYHFISLD